MGWGEDINYLDNFFNFCKKESRKTKRLQLERMLLYFRIGNSSLMLMGRGLEQKQETKV